MYIKRIIVPYFQLTENAYMCVILIRFDTDLVGFDVDGKYPGLGPADWLFHGVDQTAVEHPQHSGRVQIQVDGILNGIRVTLVVQFPARVWHQHRPTPVLAFQPDSGHGERDTRPEPGREHECPVTPHLSPGDDHVLSHVPSSVRVNALGGRARPLDVLAAQRVRGHVRRRVRASHAMAVAEYHEHGGHHQRHRTETGHYGPTR